jgi:hypothetical protein
MCTRSSSRPTCSNDGRSCTTSLEKLRQCATKPPRVGALPAASNARVLARMTSDALPRKWLVSSGHIDLREPGRGDGDQPGHRAPSSCMPKLAIVILLAAACSSTPTHPDSVVPVDAPMAMDVAPAPDGHPRCADLCPIGPLAEDESCKTVCPDSFLRTCPACPDLILMCDDLQRRCKYAPLCSESCIGGTVGNCTGGNDCLCEPDGGGDVFVCVGPS